ncbi:SurA N-terminal domain-containing protein [Luteimonas sp. RIT-PG2_3]
MLQALREKTSGWIAIVIVGILAIPFAFFGMEQYLFQGAADYAAKVEAPPKWWRSAPDWALVRKFAWQSEEVSTEEFRNAFEQERLRQRDQQGDQFDARGFESAEKKREVLEALIDQAVLRLASKRSGVAIGDAQLREVIESIPAFQVEGKFDTQRYQLALQGQNPPLTPRQFQDQLRENMQQSVMSAQVAQSAFVTTGEVERLMRLLGEKRDVTFLQLPPPQADTAEVSAKEIEDWHKANAQRYRAPETVSIEYVEIDGAMLPPPAEPSDAALRQRYEQEKARFIEPEQRLASHILVSVSDPKDPAAVKAAEDKANALAKQAREGADFAALAQANSEDPGSKANGGDLGWVEKGMMTGPFEDALFAMKAGEIRGPVKTDFGWHVLQLRELKGGSQTPFEAVREELAREESEASRERVFSDLSGQVVDEVFKNPTSLEAAAQLAKLPVQTIGPFRRGETSGFGALPEIQRAAFSESLIQDGTVSDPIELGPNHIALIRVTEHAPERALTLDEAREQIIADVRRDRGAKQAAAEADAVLAKLKSGGDLHAIAKERNLVAHDIPGVQRGMPIPHPVATEAYFRVAPPQEGKPSAGKAALPDNSTAVFVVSKITPGDIKEASPEELAMLRQQFSGLYGNEDSQSMLQTLRRQMKVTVVEARL